MQKERGHLDILSTVWVSALNSYHCCQCFDPGCWLGDKKGNRCFFSVHFWFIHNYKRERRQKRIKSVVQMAPSGMAIQCRPTTSLLAPVDLYFITSSKKWRVVHGCMKNLRSSRLCLGACHRWRIGEPEWRHRSWTLTQWRHVLRLKLSNSKHTQLYRQAGGHFFICL